MIPAPIWGCDRSDTTDVYGSDIGRLIFSAVRERPSGDSQGEGHRSSLDWKSLCGIDSHLCWALEGWSSLPVGKDSWRRRWHFRQRQDPDPQTKGGEAGSVDSSRGSPGMFGWRVAGTRKAGRIWWTALPESGACTLGSSRDLLKVSK